jgi:putative phosphoribosyl transferase
MHGALFEDRSEAGQRLALHLSRLAGLDVVVLALPRGGVPVGLELARGLDADLDVLMVQKLGAPGQPELAVGAVASDGALAVNPRIAQVLGMERSHLQAEANRWAGELAARAARFRSGAPPVPIAGRTVVVVDDGVATGASLRAALDVVRTHHPGELVVAVPVAPPDACEALASVADRVECLHKPPEFVAVGHWYRDFTQVSEGEVVRMLAQRAAERAGQGVSDRPRATRGHVRGDSG